MDLALAGSALLMGLAGAPHCTAMCGAACAAVTGRSRAAQWRFHLARLLSYAAGGAVLAASVSWMAQLGQASSLLRPFWVMLHLAALGLGLFLLWRGRQPVWLESLGQQLSRSAAVHAQAPLAGLAGGGTVITQPPRQPRAAWLGLGWVFWPCGLLQSALMVAALASGPVQGAAVMAVFAVASGLGLLLAPALLRRLGAGGGEGMRWAVRLAGLGLVLASGWALSHGLWARIAALCA